MYASKVLLVNAWQFMKYWRISWTVVNEQVICALTMSVAGACGPVCCSIFLVLMDEDYSCMACCLSLEWDKRGWRRKYIEYPCFCLHFAYNDGSFFMGLSARLWRRCIPVKQKHIFWWFIYRLVRLLSAIWVNIVIQEYLYLPPRI
jgi:hypothetical protein